MAEEQSSNTSENPIKSTPSKKSWLSKHWLELLGATAITSMIIMTGGYMLSRTDWYQNLSASSYDYSQQSSYQTNLQKRISERKRISSLESAKINSTGLEGLVTTGSPTLEPNTVFSPSPLDSMNFQNPKLRGSTFYVEKPSSGFTERVSNWLDYLGIASLLPDPEEVSATQISNTLQKIGNTRLYGLASNESNALLFRPGDYSTFIHEMKHLAREDDFNALGGEAGSYAIAAFAGGDYELAVDALNGLYLDNKTEGILTRWLTEAIFVGGDETFAWLKEYDHAKVKYGDKVVDLVGLVEHLQKRTQQFEEEVLHSGITPEQYLVEFHKVSFLVARKIMEATGETSLESVLRGTNETKKKMISAFKALTSFYYVNLGYILSEAASRADQHFEKDEALTIASTLFYGAKEVYARFEEYNVPPEMQKQVVEMLISNGSDFARLYADAFPRLLDFTSNNGKRGWMMMDRFFSDEDFRQFLLKAEGLKALERLYKDDPSITPTVVDELLGYRFNYEKSKVFLNTDGFAYTNSRFTSAQKAEVITATLILSSMDYGSPYFDKQESWDKNSRDGKLISCREFQRFKVEPFLSNYQEGLQCIATLKKNFSNGSGQ